MDPWALIISTLVVYTSGFRILCYFTYPTQNITGEMMFEHKHVNPNLCTHLVYSHASIKELNIVPPVHDQENSKTGMYEEIVKFKLSNPKLKVLLAVGNHMDTPEMFFDAAESDSSRAVFAKSVGTYLLSKHFDGVQMEWANFDAQKYPRYDKNKVLLLLKALKLELKLTSKNTLILAATLPAYKKQIDREYIIQELVKETDFITIRTLDMHTGGNVGFSAPFRFKPLSTGDERYLNVRWITRYYLSLKVPKEKINIGIPTFGRSFKLKSKSDNKIGDAAVPEPQNEASSIVGYAERSSYSKRTSTANTPKPKKILLVLTPDCPAQVGQGNDEMLKQICRLIQGGGTVEHDESQAARYYTKDNVWISYEDILSVSQKTCFVQELDLGGITFWTLNSDDFTGLGCQHGDYPLIRTATNLMTYTDKYMCNRLNKTLYVDVPPPMNAPRPPLLPLLPRGKRIVCYYTNWAQLRPGKGKFLPENINPLFCTHIVYAYAVLKDFTVAPFFPNDESKPWIEGMYGRVLRAKKRNPNLKVLLGIGGGNSPNTNLENVLTDTTVLEDVANRITNYIHERCFDGLEVTWQEPSVRWKPNFSYFIQILRATFVSKGIFHGLPRRILSVALTSSKDKIDAGYGNEISLIASSADFLSIMTYDFYGTGDVSTGHNSPLFSNPVGSTYERQLSVDWVANYYLSLGVPKDKMDIGIATYGRSFTLSCADKHNLQSPATGPGKAGEFTGVAGILAYYEICNFIANGTSITYVPSQRVSYAYSGTQWVGFDDTDSVLEKVCYVLHHGFGGVNVRTLDFDDFTGEFCKKGKYPLLSTIHLTMNNVDKYVCNSVITTRDYNGHPTCNSLLYICLVFLWLVGRFFLT